MDFVPLEKLLASKSSYIRGSDLDWESNILLYHFVSLYFLSHKTPCSSQTEIRPYLVIIVSLNIFFIIDLRCSFW